MNAIKYLDGEYHAIGHAYLGLHGDKQGSVKQKVHDGDTISVRAAGNISVRFLGIDTPEISFRLPGGHRFLSIRDSRWGEYLKDPFDKKWPAFEQKLPEGLREHLKSCIGEETAANHYHFAQLAQRSLESEVEKDIKVMGGSLDDFRFYLAFAYEIMDGYGRFLCYVNREQPDPNQPTKRPPTYNERLLEQALALPYFIWPNVNPWRTTESVIKAVPKPGTAHKAAEQDSLLSHARDAFQNARRKHIGIYDAMQPLLLEPFELRYLSRRSLPSRYVIDLTSDSNLLIKPENYYRIPHAEDRLWIPAEFVPLFVEQGWQREM